MTVAMGTTIKNLRNLFCGVKRDHPKKILVSDNYQNHLLLVFNNPFTTDTGAPEKNSALLYQ